MDEKLTQYIQQIPKAELHLHIEGTFEPELMFEIAKRNNVPIKYKSTDEIKQAYQFSNLQDFLDIYYAAADVLLYEKDFYDLTMNYLKRVHQDNVIHTEIFFDPQTHTARGVSYDTVINGINAALIDAKKEFGISTRLIMCFLRHLSEESALETLELALNHKDKIIGIGLDSSEKGHPPAKFINAFRRAKEEGFLLVAHAGEEGPAQNVKDAIEMLHVERIDHGVRSIDDEELMKELGTVKMPLTVCPLSNLKLKVVKDLSELPVKTFLEKGLMVTLNSDDPSYFGGYVNENYLQTAEALHLSRKDIFTLAKNSFTASFISEKEKEHYYNLLEEFDKSFN